MSQTTLRWVLVVVVAVLIVALLGYARGEPGDDGRTPDAEEIGLVIEQGA